MLSNITSKTPQAVIDARTKRLVATALGATIKLRRRINTLTNCASFNPALSSAALKNLSTRALIKEFAKETGLFTEQELQNL